tara:strand:+ start:77 stop:268 length:192 start_codon:yes stop_codon:yes gene_type:complete
MQQQTNESLVRERDFYRAKLEGLEKKNKQLNEDCAYLKKSNDTLLSKVKDLNNQIFYRNKRRR